MIADVGQLLDDPARVVLIGLGGVLAGMAALVFADYAALVRRGYRGALNVHVALISFSYLILVAVALIAVYERAGTGFHSRLILVPIAELIGIGALTLILRDLRRRRQAR